MFTPATATMPLREEFESSGNWLFRHRSYLPLLLLAVVVPALRGFRYPDGQLRLDRQWELVCLAVGLLGVGVRAATIGYTPRGTSGRNTHGQVADVLNSRGIYSIVRHPLYVGNYFMWLGPALIPRSWAVATIVTLVFWLYYERIMFAEEEFLRRKFGESYERWASATPAFIPDPRRWVPPAVAFSLRNVLKREYSGLFGLIATMTVLELIAEYEASGRVWLDPMWAWIFGLALATYLTLLTVARTSRILQVEGR